MLLCVGCLYLASKAEESLLGAKHFVFTAQRKWGKAAWPYDVKHVLDAEMVCAGVLLLYCFCRSSPSRHSSGLLAFASTSTVCLPIHPAFSSLYLSS